MGMMLWVYVAAGAVGLILLILFVYRRMRGKDSEERRLNGIIEKLSGDMAERVIRSVPDIIFIVDKNYKIRRILNDTSDTQSAPIEFLVGKYLNEAVDIGYTVPVMKAIQRALQTDEVVQTEYAMTINRVSEFYEARFKSIEKDLIVCFERNITERRKKDEAIRQTEILMSKVLDYMPMPVAIKDINHNLRYIFWNKECEKLLKHSRKGVLGKTDIDLYGEEAGEKQRLGDREIITSRKPYHTQTEQMDSDGKKLVTIVNKSVISNNVHNWLLTTQWDISDLIRYQDQLQEANQQLEIAFDVSLTSPIIWDVERDVLYLKFPEYNEGSDGPTQGQKGLRSQEFINRLFPEESEEVTRSFNAIKAGKMETIHHEIRFNIANKQENYYEIYLAIEKRDESGIPLRVIGALRNITERKLYEKSLVEAKKNIEEGQKMNQLILDNTNSGLVYLSPDYTVQWENVTKYKELGIAAKYESGLCCFKSIEGQTEPCDGCVARKAFESKKVERAEVDLSDGVAIAVTATPILNIDSTISGIVLKYDDITQQRKAATELQRAKEAAETSDKLKSLFISNMSHEIRTPLNAIVGFSDLLINAKTDKDKKDFAAVIKRNNDLLLQLVNDILDLSKIESNTLDFVFSNVDINEMFRNLELSTNCKMPESKDLSVVFTPALKYCIIQTEKNRIQQVIINLINNAIKFTEKGTINIGYEVLDEGMRFYVTDTGIGIPKDKQDAIFDRFVKLDNFVSGTGLGLSISKTIIDKLEGTFGVDSEEGKGSSFWFILPVKPIITHEKTEEDELLTTTVTDNDRYMTTTVTVNRRARKPRPVVLIAEDALDNYNLYVQLMIEKFTLLHAWNGKEAVDLYHKHKEEIDVIIMDIKMPEMDGYEATELIRRDDPDVPIIAASAYAFADDIAKIMTSGFNDYLSKPINKNALFSSLDMLLGE